MGNAVIVTTALIYHRQQTKQEHGQSAQSFWLYHRRPTEQHNIKSAVACRSFEASLLRNASTGVTIRHYVVEHHVLPMQ